jgi:dipeptidyl aminopeptidase/acylaminoacyl peptidase
MNQSPYGTWPSPLSPDVIVADSVRLGDACMGGDSVYWTEGRPTESGRQVLVRRRADGTLSDITPAPFSVRTRVHEYGGNAFTVEGLSIWFSNDVDGRLYTVDADECAPRPLTIAGAWRYAEPRLDAANNRLVCVRETPVDSGEPINELVAVALSDGAVQVLATGHDFYACPRPNGTGAQLAFITWDHPAMPWDGTQLWSADVDSSGALSSLTCQAGGDEESVVQPEWSPQGILHFASDRTGWWNLYCVANGKTSCIHEAPFEFGRPHWVFGLNTYGFMSDGRIACAWGNDGFWSLGILDNGNLNAIELSYTSFDCVRVNGERVVCIAGAPDTASVVLEVDMTTGNHEVHQYSSRLDIDPQWLSHPESIWFPSGGAQVHAFYYAPTSMTHAASDEERPPLIVIGHGGPTSSTSAVLDARVQYWTSRGFAVVDVNYRGSTGFGRPYRDALKGQWGVVDVLDCVSAARHLASSDRVDGERLIIRGGSAGGFTALAALCFHDVFAAAASYYGIGELEALATDTHKFESRYLDSLIGAYPEEQALYKERSPINHIDALSCPAIFFQGLEDKVVPPNQAEMMVTALREKGLPVAYLAFEGEAHGFRQAETIKRTLSAELQFYGKVLGFVPAGEFAPLDIENLDSGNGG